MRKRKEEKKSAKKSALASKKCLKQKNINSLMRGFIVGHLQRMIFFVTNLKFWSSFSLLLLLIANFLFHTEQLVSTSQNNFSPAYETNRSSPEDTDSSPSSLNYRQSLSNLKLITEKNSEVYSCAASMLNPTEGTNQLKQNNYRPPIASQNLSTSPDNSITISSSTTKILNSINHSEKPPDSIPQSEPPKTKSKIIVTILTAVAIVEHLIPRRILKALASAVRK